MKKLDKKNSKKKQAEENNRGAGIFIAFLFFIFLIMGLWCLYNGVLEIYYTIRFGELIELWRGIAATLFGFIVTYFAGKIFIGAVRIVLGKN